MVYGEYTEDWCVMVYGEYTEDWCFHDRTLLSTQVYCQLSTLYSTSLA